MVSNKKIVAFAGGGSGGHVYPLIAVADELRRMNKELEIYFVSSHGSIEEKLVPRAGYPLHLIHSGKLAGQSMQKKFITLIKVFFSIFHSAIILLKQRPGFVFSAGGYAGAPVVLAAKMLGIPCGILEQNRRSGLANRWMAKFCARIFLNFPEAIDGFDEKKSRVVGHPCRKEIESVKWSAEEAQEKFRGLPFKLFVFGGSQGAVGVNRLVVDALPYLKDLDLEILHQTGALDFENTKAAYVRAGYTRGKVVDYIYDMAAAYGDAHLVVCRAGASSIAELAAAGKATFLIPLVSKDKHQEHNARALADRGACEYGLQAQLTGELLANKIKEFYNDRNHLMRLSAEMAKFHRADAARAIGASILGDFL